MAAGHVVALHRWPVKSMAGERVEALALDGFGATGDRTHAIFDVFKGAPRRVNAEVLPRLLAWAAAYPDLDPVDREMPPRPVLTAPDGTRHDWDDAALAAALEVDVRRFRSNVHLELDAAPWAELDWIGRRLVVGDAELEIVEPCERCAIPTRDPETQDRWPQLLKLLAAERSTNFGLIARTVTPAVVRDGDRAVLLD
jgi:uncharacterized protein YcbX